MATVVKQMRLSITLYMHKLLVFFITGLSTAEHMASSVAMKQR